jgi:DNA invertase Pin-like site-specific DNA recombinase
MGQKSATTSLGKRGITPGRAEAMAERAAIWLRVSTASQDSDNQRPALEAMAAQRGLEITEVYQVSDSAWQDKGSSSEYVRTRQRMLADAHAGKFRYLLIWSLDRLTRRGIEDAFALTRQLDEFGVTLVSTQDPWLSTTDAFAREIMLSIFSSVAKFESARRSERVRAGLARRKAQGLPVGRQAGARDRAQRRRSGYVAAWEPGGARRAAEA